jgi:hypothetical protein
MHFFVRFLKDFHTPHQWLFNDISQGSSGWRIKNRCTSLLESFAAAAGFSHSLVRSMQPGAALCGCLSP